MFVGFRQECDDRFIHPKIRRHYLVVDSFVGDRVMYFLTGCCCNNEIQFAELWPRLFKMRCTHNLLLLLRRHVSSDPPPPRPLKRFYFRISK